MEDACDFVSRERNIPVCRKRAQAFILRLYCFNEGRIHDFLISQLGLSPLEVECAINTHPKVFKIMNFLSAAECDHIIAKGKAQLSRSTTGGMLSDTRTSQTAWVRRTSSPMLDRIVRRVADLVKIPEKVLTMNKASEEIQLVHYNVGQFYNSHHDWSIEDYPSRYLTLLFYLTDQVSTLPCMLSIHIPVLACS